MLCTGSFASPICAALVAPRPLWVVRLDFIVLPKPSRYGFDLRFRLCNPFQWFLTALSVLPGIILAISAQRLPISLRKHASLNTHEG
jgi:hypothetical protein